MKDTENYKNDPKLQSNRLISQEARIRPYIDEQFFLIAHEEPSMKTGTYAEETNLTIAGKSYRTKIIHDKDSEGNEVLDVPMLSNDAMNILFEILRRAKNYMPNANASDPYEHYEMTKNSYITLKSALKIGDTNTLASTGYTFILYATDDVSKKALKIALESLDMETKSDEAITLGLETNIFSYEEDSEGNVSISVSLPDSDDDGSTDKKTDTTKEEKPTEKTIEENSTVTTQEDVSQE